MSREQRTTVSAVLIVKDEEDVLEACLASVAWADEIVVYDTGSTDATREIAARYTDVVVRGFWDDDFGAARNRALERATGRWVLSIDADEVFDGDPAVLRRRLGRGGATEHVLRIQHPGALSAAALTETVGTRVFRRDLYRWVGRLHERVVRRFGGAQGVERVALGDVRLLHFGYLPEVMVAKGKAERNLRLSQREVEDAEGTGTLEDLAVLQANLARSLVVADRLAPALALAEEVWAGGLLPAIRAGELAAAMTTCAHRHGDLAEVERWLARWASTGPDPGWANARAAELAANRGDSEAALRALAQVRASTVDPDGRRLDRVDLARVEVWALVQVEQWDRACDVAIEAARAGRVPGEPTSVLLAFDRAGRDPGALLDLLGPDVWRTFVALTSHADTAGALGALERMDAHRPSDVGVLTCAASWSGRMSTVQAMEWSARIRRAGLTELCPLRIIAASTGLDAADRAVAAAIAFQSYGDASVVPDLEDALTQVRPDQEAALAALIESVAPGLLAPAP